ncbi:MAG: hypothetical protein ABSF14_08945 [Terriglobia bacterium]
MRESYFQFVNECWEFGGTKAEEVDEIITLAMPAYLRLKSDLGYAPLLEMLLLGSIGALGESHRRYFELGSGIQAVRAFQREHPDDVRFNVDRRGEIRYVKFRQETLRIRARRDLPH